MQSFNFVSRFLDGSIYFEERNVAPQEESSRIFIARGFYKEVTIQDFPRRGHTVYLRVKQRRWLDKRDWVSIFAKSIEHFHAIFNRKN